MITSPTRITKQEVNSVLARASLAYNVITDRSQMVRTDDGVKVCISIDDLAIITNALKSYQELAFSVNDELPQDKKEG